MTITRQKPVSFTPLNTQTRSKQHGSVGPAHVYPATAEFGSGAQLFCSDGQEVTDLLAALGAISLGYGDKGVAEAITRQVAHGSILSLPHQLENIVAGMLADHVPCAEQTRFVMTGSEAVQGAVQIARSVTKRSNILVADTAYHGWHEWFQSQYRQPVLMDGTDNPEEFADCYASMAASIETFKYGDIDDLRSKITKRTAAVLIEPYRFPVLPIGLERAPQDDERYFVRQVKALTNAHGALLIFDEMIFGFRHALAGSQSLFSARDTLPDIATFGKGLGNGVPIAAICGSRDVMEAAHLISSTFGGSLLGLSAAKEVITRYVSEDVSETMWQLGLEIQKHFYQVADGTGVRFEGYPVHFRLAGLEADQMDILLSHAYADGVLMHRACANVIASMTIERAGEVGKILGRAAIQATSAPSELVSTQGDGGQ